MGVITIPQVLREKLGEDGADAFVEVIREIDLDARKDALSLAEERFEKRLTEEFGKLRLEIEKVRVEIEKVRSEMRVETEKVRSEMRLEMEKLRTETNTGMEMLRTEIERNKADVIKWNFSSGSDKSGLFRQ